MRGSRASAAFVRRVRGIREWGSLFRFRTTWGLILGFFGIVYMTWLFQGWLPGYLEIQRHLSIAKTGWVAAIPFFFDVVGSIGFGWVADRLMGAGCSPVNSRKLPIVLGLIGMAARGAPPGRSRASRRCRTAPPRSGA